MGNSKLVFYFLLFIISLCSSSVDSNHKCPVEQRDALLVFKQNISSINNNYYKISSYCQDLYGSSYVPIRMNWNRSTDCCDWVGITCNNFTRDVITLNLTCSKLKGVLELDILLSSLPKLEVVDLSYNRLSVMSTNDAPHVNSSLHELRLASCNLTVFPEFLSVMKNLRVLDLSSNYISGHIPSWAREIGGNSLSYLDLSHNSIRSLSDFRSDGLEYLDMQTNLIEGPFPTSICNMKHLKFLDLSFNGIIGMVPQCLQNISSSLMYLNIGSNIIQEPFPQIICHIRSLLYLDMSNNSISGMVPQCLQNLNSSLVSLNVGSNMIQGQFPKTICNMSSLLYLDMSINSFDGVIPRCFGNITSSLAMINLAENKFHGTIPNVYGSCGLVDGLMLNGNMLEGEVPRSLESCRSLKILDLGNNLLNSTFPHWLGCHQNLQVLILRSNNLHGTIETPSAVPFIFPSLRVFDISSNEFVGCLPEKYFESFNAIKDVDKGQKKEFMNISGLHPYIIKVPVKGLKFLNPTGIYIISTVLDLSSNRFEGEIPDVIGNLKSLRVLNLSNNNLSGQIPDVVGNILYIEVIDLSRNQLVGEIPQSLINLTGLELFNVSQNHLEGRLLEGGQFSTFTQELYLGNPGLCGPPLETQCEDLSFRRVEPKGEEEWFNMESLMLGLGTGTLLGVMLGYGMLSTGKPKWVNVIAHAGWHTKPKKQIKPIQIRKRN